MTSQHHPVDYWGVGFESCIVIRFDEVTFNGDTAWGYVHTPPSTANGFALTWNKKIGRYVFQDGVGLLIRGDFNSFLLIILIGD